MLQLVLYRKLRKIVPKVSKVGKSLRPMFQHLLCEIKQTQQSHVLRRTQIPLDRKLGKVIPQVNEIENVLNQIFRRPNCGTPLKSQVKVSTTNPPTI